MTVGEVTTAARLASAVAAARAVAAEHGLRTEPRVLQDGFNVVLHLFPTPVVARVGTLTRLLRRDGFTSFDREVSLAGTLAAAGAPVVPPSDLLPPGPHRQGDTVLSFWTHVTVLPERPGPPETAAAFTELHAGLAEQPATGSPLDTPLRDLESFLAHARRWGAPRVTSTRSPNCWSASARGWTARSDGCTGTPTPATCWPPRTAGAGPIRRTPAAGPSPGTWPAYHRPARRTDGSRRPARRPFGC